MQLFTFETAKSAFTPQPGADRPLLQLPAGVPISSVAGATAGFVSCCVMYPLELLKTRLTVQVRQPSHSTCCTRLSGMSGMDFLLRDGVSHTSRSQHVMHHCVFVINFLLSRWMCAQPEEYRGFIHALVRIVSEEGVHELYRGLGPSLVGIIPYAGANYYAYDKLRSLYRKFTKKKEIDSVATLAIGSLAGAFAASATFPLEVTRKQVSLDPSG